jgi:mono/diheme cytochrome c family protein
VRYNRRSFVSGSTAMLLLALAFAATAGGEFVREGIRKPYTVRHRLYANSILEDDVRQMRRVGCTTLDPYPPADAADYPTNQLQTGVKTYRLLCSVCHTKDGANGLLPLMRTWTLDQRRLMIAQLQRTKPFMPPFAGTAEELEALVQWLLWEEAGRPLRWPESRDETVLAKIQGYLDEAGTGSGIAAPAGHGAEESSGQ